jgi:hypothetical protein
MRRKLTYAKIKRLVNHKILHLFAAISLIFTNLADRCNGLQRDNLNEVLRNLNRK